MAGKTSAQARETAAAKAYNDAYNYHTSLELYKKSLNYADQNFHQVSMHHEQAMQRLNRAWENRLHHHRAQVEHYMSHIHQWHSDRYKQLEQSHEQALVAVRDLQRQVAQLSYATAPSPPLQQFVPGMDPRRFVNQFREFIASAGLSTDPGFLIRVFSSFMASEPAEWATAISRQPQKYRVLHTDFRLFERAFITRYANNSPARSSPARSSGFWSFLA